MTKDQLRKKYKEKRAALTVIEKDKMEDLILIQFQKLGLHIPDLIMTYCSSEKLMEYDPCLIERFCSFKNPEADIAYPAIDKDDIMKAFVIGEETLFQTNKFGIDEPVNGIEIDNLDIEMVLIPLLTFDIKGYRVGYGKGYYDRFLSKCKPTVQKIGFCFFEAEEISDINEFDVPMNICITPHQIYTFDN